MQERGVGIAAGSRGSQNLHVPPKGGLVDERTKAVEKGEVEVE
jgi:hypothetical protein